MNITKIISKTFDSRLKQIDLYANRASEIQHRVLSRLTRQVLLRLNGEESTIIPLSVTMKISENVFLSKHTKKSNLM